MSVTSSAAPRSALAASRPPKPQPMMTTRGRGEGAEEVVMPPLLGLAASGQPVKRAPSRARAAKQGPPGGGASAPPPAARSAGREGESGAAAPGGAHITP